jgi:hypothetical protein
MFIFLANSALPHNFLNIMAHTFPRKISLRALDSLMISRMASGGVGMDEG